MSTEAMREAQSKLIKIAAQMAMRLGMPDVDNVPFSPGVPKKVWRSLNLANAKAESQCGEWAIQCREIYDAWQAATNNQEALIKAALEVAAERLFQSFVGTDVHPALVATAVEAIQQITPQQVMEKMK